MTTTNTSFNWNVPLTEDKMICGNCVPDEVLVPAGTYYIGDPCYAIGDSPIYEEAWANTGYSTPAVYRSEQGIVYIDATSYGDGGYSGSDGFEYSVDAGVISVISREIIQEWMDSQGDFTPLEDTIYGGKLHTFLHPVRCIFGDGEFEFQDMNGHDILRINTRGDDTDDEDEEDEDTDYDDKSDEDEEDDEEEPQLTK